MSEPHRSLWVASLAGIVISIAIRADGSAPAKVLTKPLPPVLNVTTGELPKTPTAAVQMRAGVLAPETSTFWHTHPSPPFIYVESGTGIWEYKGRPSETRRAGQAIMEPANVVMRVVNPGSSPLRLIIFQASKPGDPVILPAH